MGLVRPAGGDASADGVAGPEIDDAGGIGVVADGIRARRATVMADAPTSAVALLPETAQVEARLSWAAA